MSKSLMLGAVLGGIVVFIWSFVSWSVLPWHSSMMHAFADEGQMSLALLANAPEGGMYMMPAPAPGYASMTPEQKRVADAEMAERTKTGRYFFGVVHRRANNDMVRPMLYALLFDLLGALLITMLVMKTWDMTYWGRVSFIVTAALAVGIIGYVPEWIWFQFPTRWVLVNIADTLAGWLLAGMVIAKVAAPRAGTRVAAA